VKEDPDNPFFNNVAGLATQERSLEKALLYFNEGIRLDPASPQLRYNRAMVLLQMGDHRAAIVDIKATIALDTTFTQAYNDLASAYDQIGQLDSAMVYFEEAIHRYPSGAPSVLVARASILFKAGRWGEARRDVEEALRLDPLKGEGYHVRGLMHLAVGDSVSACKDLYSAFTMLPDPGHREEVRALGMTLCPNGPE
jgi:tetratricopeptide (TPR) repeat protein